MSKKTTLFLVGGILLAMLLAAGTALWYERGFLDSYVLREKIEKVARDRLHADIELASFHVSFFPGFEVQVTGFVLRNPQRPDVPPTIEIRKFTVQAGLLALFERRPHLHALHIQGLIVNIPPRQPNKAPHKPFHTNFLIDEITADNMTLNIFHKNGSPPMRFLLHKLRINSFQPDNPAQFRASLTNPKPVGEIQTQGQFGPWDPDDPSQTAVAGSYTFSNADLGTIKGISGTLSSKGSFDGVLDYIEVQGKTETPNFEVNVSKHPMPLDTQFSAVVDGMNGNTILNSIQIQLRDSQLIAKGDVAKGPRQPGRAVALHVVARSARAQDLLRVAVKSDKPLLTGMVSMNTQFVIPSRRANDTDITNRLDLRGQFNIASAHFTRNSIQKKINALSRRGLGHPNDPADSDAASAFTGAFTLRNGIVKFSRLTFKVSGAAVLLNGTYNLDTEALNFRGTLSLEAKLSQTTTGMKSLLLKLVNPVFEKKNAGAVLPIKITGTREKPSFGLDLGRVFAKK
jgi:AsmA-like C-terminal region